MGAVEEGVTFEYLYGLRDAVAGWLAELDSVIAEKVEVEGLVQFQGCAARSCEGEPHEELVLGGSPEVELAAVVGQPEGLVPVEQEHAVRSYEVTLVEPATVVEQSAVEQLACEQSYSPPQRVTLDTREVSESERPPGMVPTSSGHGWVRRGGTPGPVYVAASEKVCEMASTRCASLAEIGRAYQSIMRSYRGA
jgi:hypothetical protein